MIANTANPEITPKTIPTFAPTLRLELDERSSEEVEVGVGDDEADEVILTDVDVQRVKVSIRAD